MGSPARQTPYDRPSPAGRPQLQQKQVRAMRHALFALLSLCSLGAVADDNWKPFPHDQSSFDYSGDKLRQAWPQLTRGFGANYPFPDAEWVVEMATRNPKALELTVGAASGQSGYSGKPEEAERYASQLQD